MYQLFLLNNSTSNIVRVPQAAPLPTGEGISPLVKCDAIPDRTRDRISIALGWTAIQHNLNFRNEVVPPPPDSGISTCTAFSLYGSISCQNQYIF